MGDKNNENILSIRGMSKSFGRNRVLDHINLDVKKGTVMGLMWITIMRPKKTVLLWKPWRGKTMA